MDIYNKAKRSEIMSLVKHSRTNCEEAIALILKKLKIKYRRNLKILPGRPDFVIANLNSVIFVHGCFWHDHTNCKLARRPKINKAFWKQKAIDNKKRDLKKTRLLRKLGWHVLTVWQCQIKKNPVKVALKIKNFLNKSK